MLTEIEKLSSVWWNNLPLFTRWDYVDYYYHGFSSGELTQDQVTYIYKSIYHIQ